MALGLLYVVVAALALGLGSLAQGVAVLRHRGPLAGLLTHPLFLAGLVGDGVGFVAHVLALQAVPMAVAQGAVSGSLAVTAVGARLWLRTRFARREWLAVAAVCVGLLVLAAFSGGTGTVTDETPLGIGLASATAVLGLLTVLAAVAAPARRGAALAVVSGLGFAVCSLAVRLVDTSSVLGALVDPALLVVAAAGAVGGVAWVLALRHASVTAVTGIVVVAEVVPASLLGPWLLGDPVLGGFGVVAPLVLAATAAASVVLARAGHAAPEHVVPEPRILVPA